ncbi:MULTISPECIES: helix-turn-helix transcriptional regulator [unclassified Exiguobacterium]|uniref:helix-turn-helix domain-containing protein n=1 Tax=unclassified Exiguobacterium TaxID=2644629 RepID=UPI001BE706E9|nr:MULTISPECIES: helix-turn-helix transcriptional regulator [unclassified Exiguobacterium]
MAKVYLDRIATSELPMKVLEKYPCEMSINLNDILAKKGVTPLELHQMTGLRLATISEIGKAKKHSINLFHLAVIMAALRITDLSELIEISFDEEQVKAWKKEEEEFPNMMTPSQKQDRIEMLSSND